MALIVRGAVWFGVYVFLVLLPLATAVVVQPNRLSPSFGAEIAVGAGFVGLALMSLEFALVARIKPAASAFGEDSLQLFHNMMGMVALVLIIAHPVILIAVGYPASCWLNPFAACGNASTVAASLSLYAVILLVVTSIWRKQLRISYEVWHVIHGLFALFAVLAALVHILVIGRYTSTPVMRSLWLIYAALMVFSILWFRILKPVFNRNRKWEVVENRVELGDARTLVLQPVGHPGFTFMPGQFSWLKTGGSPFGVGQHPISMSSNGDAPDGRIAFTIRNLGDWSGEEVPALQPGDKIWVDGPHGVFSTDREGAMGYVLVGGGVGITPLYSMCQTMASRGDVRPVILFYGAIDQENITFREELDALSEQMNLTVVYVLSEPEESWEGESGFITGEIMLRYLPDQYKRFIFLTCGPEPLMDAMEKEIPTLGVPREHVQTERFNMV